MIGMLGANLAEMESLQQRFRLASSEVADLTARVQGTVGTTTWTGPAADRFRARWETEFRSALAGLQAALDENASFVGGRLEAIRVATS